MLKKMKQGKKKKFKERKFERMKQDFAGDD